MRILLVADGRSPIACRFLEGLAALGYTVCLISTFPCDRSPYIAELHILPVALSRWAGSHLKTPKTSVFGESLTGSRRLVSQFRPIFMRGRYILGPISLVLSGNINKFQQVTHNFQPDLVHALRIPYEGMLASYRPDGIPLVVSIWGNDLTLHAHGSLLMAGLTRRTLQRAQGLVADAKRDLRLAQDWGYPAGRPSLVVPGSMGIDLKEIAACKNKPFLPEGDPLPIGTHLVINPRGFRPGSLRQDIFFQAIPLVLAKNPNITFICPSMEGQGEATHWLKKLNIDRQVRLLPTLSQVDLWTLFHRCEVFVSPSVHDGVPNSFLESIACGCFPVTGDIESLREWITPGVNGLLVDSADPESLAGAILTAINSLELREQAAEINKGLIMDRAEISSVRNKVSNYYQQVLNL